MRRPSLATRCTCLAAFAAFMGFGPEQALARPAGPCQPIPVVIDSAPSDTLVVPFDGRGWGQVIRVADTLVSQVQFEMPDSLPFDFSQAILYITTVDGTGRPELLLSPPLYASQIIGPPPHSGNVETPLVFAFDLPIALPGFGQYFFDVCEVACLGLIQLSAETHNSYGGGAAWSTSKVCGPAGPGAISLSNPNVDLLCTITYCEAVTPTMRRTWGAVKLIYR